MNRAEPDFRRIDLRLLQRLQQSWAVTENKPHTNRHRVQAPARKDAIPFLFHWRCSWPDLWIHSSSNAVRAWSPPARTMADLRHRRLSRPADSKWIGLRCRAREPHFPLVVIAL